MLARVLHTIDEADDRLYIAAIEAEAIATERTRMADELPKALATLGYPPIKELHGSRGASGHYERDNIAYAAAILAIVNGEAQK